MTTQNDSVSVIKAVPLVLKDEHGIRKITPSSERWLINSTKSFTRYLKNDKFVTDISVLDVHNWVQHEIDRGLKPITANSYLRGLKTLYSRLNKLNFIEYNPAEPVSYLPQDPKSPKAVSKTTYLKLLGAADNSRNKAIISVLWATGCRLGGLVSMNINQIDHWEKNDEPCYAIHVIEKFSKPRWVYVRDREARNLAQWIDKRPHVTCNALFLSNTNERLSAGGVTGMFRKLRRIMGITAKTISNPHAFRHAFAIRKLDGGCDLALVSQWLGHNDPAFTASIYAVRSEAQLREAYFK